MPAHSPDNPARTTREQLAALDAGATVNDSYELVYPDTQQRAEAAEDVFTREQALAELFKVYRGTDPEMILAAADARGIWEDEQVHHGHAVNITVRAHQLSVNEPVSYTVEIW